MKAFAITDIGRKRQLNQDHVYASAEPAGHLPNLFVVADGMGGHRAGGYASSYAVETITGYAARSEQTSYAGIMTSAIREANHKIAAKAAEDERFAGMGTTVVAAVVDGHVLHAANVGDSRLYLIGHGIEQVTEDHSLVQEMVRIGGIRPEEARNHPNKHIITRAVGLEEDLQVDYFCRVLEPGMLVLMCSDGLTDMLEDEEILSIMKLTDTIEERGRYLVNAANDRGGRDNIAVVIIDPFN